MPGEVFSHHCLPPCQKCNCNVSLINHTLLEGPELLLHYKFVRTVTGSGMPGTVVPYDGGNCSCPEGTVPVVPYDGGNLLQGKAVLYDGGK